MAFETIFDNYHIIIVNNEDKIEGFIEEEEGIIQKNYDSIEITILDLETSCKYITHINNYENIDKFPEFMQNLKIITNVICSSLENKNDNIQCSLIKQEDKIIIDMVYKAQFFEIPFQIPVSLESQNENNILERKVKQLKMQNNELKQTIMDMKTTYEEQIYEVNLYGPFFQQYLYNNDNDIRIIQKEFCSKARIQNLTCDQEEYLHVLKHTHSFEKHITKLIHNMKSLDHICEVFLPSNQIVTQNTYVYAVNRLYNHNGLNIIKTNKEFTIKGFCLYDLDKMRNSVLNKEISHKKFLKLFFICEIPFKVKDSFCSQNLEIPQDRFIMKFRYVIVDNKLYMYGKISMHYDIRRDSIFRTCLSSNCDWCFYPYKCRHFNKNIIPYPILNQQNNLVKEASMPNYQFKNKKINGKYLVHINVTFSNIL